jgi:hypothetical protein
MALTIVTEESLPHDFKLDLAQQVGIICSKVIGALHSSRAPIPVPSSHPQRFLYKTRDITGVDRDKLKQEILDTVFKHGAPPPCTVMPFSLYLHDATHDPSTDF